LANAGDFTGARVALDQVGGFDAALATASPEELMSLADIARASGGREQAVRALRQVLSAHASAPEAPLAAWTLGNMLDKAGDRKGAAEAFALYRRLSPTGDFAEDAAARQVDVALSQGNPERVTELVEEYARSFPNGRRVAEFRRALAKLTAPKKDSTDPSNKAASESEDESAEAPLEPDAPEAPAPTPAPAASPKASTPAPKP
jgi:TolA-binding protein